MNTYRDVESEISRSQNILKEEKQQFGEFVCLPSKALKLSKTNSFNTETHSQTSGVTLWHPKS